MKQKRKVCDDTILTVLVYVTDSPVMLCNRSADADSNATLRVAILICIFRVAFAKNGLLSSNPEL